MIGFHDNAVSSRKSQTFFIKRKLINKTPLQLQAFAQ